MNTKGNLAVAVMAGISIEAMSVMAVHAQEAKTPPAYPNRGTMSSVAARLRFSRANRRRASWCSRSTVPRKLLPGITRLPLRPSSQSGREPR
jgi:hypothetical protein